MSSAPRKQNVISSSPNTRSASRKFLPYLLVFVVVIWAASNDPDERVEDHDGSFRGTQTIAGVELWRAASGLSHSDTPTSLVGDTVVPEETTAAAPGPEGPPTSSTPGEPRVVVSDHCLCDGLKCKILENEQCILCQEPLLALDAMQVQTAPEDASSGGEGEEYRHDAGRGLLVTWAMLERSWEDVRRVVGGILGKEDLRTYWTSLPVVEWVEGEGGTVGGKDRFY